jgi:predicted nucleic acid-binding protein
MRKTSLLVAVLDACVLYPPSLRDLFMRLAAGLVFQPHWTEEIHAEWMRNVLKDRPQITPAQLERTRRLMDQINDESLVTGYEVHLASLFLPDPDDRHVLAAALASEAAVIVTFNLSDFPQALLAPFGVRALHPDKYLTALFQEVPDLFLTAVREHRTALTRPPKTVETYLATLQANRLMELATILAEHYDKI